MMRALALMAAATCLVAAPALAQQAEPVTGRTIVIAKDKSAAYRLDEPAGEIVVAKPETLQLVAMTDRSFYLRGVALGSTNLLIYDRQHHLTNVVDVRVGYDVDSLNADLSAALPGEQIKATNLAGGVLLSGSASTSAVAARAEAIAETYAPKAVTSSVAVQATQQVVVEVRVIEASRSALKDLGFNLGVHNNSGLVFNGGNGLVGNDPAQGTLSVATNIGQTRIDLTLRALEGKGVVRTLAQPNLAAVSGESASFLAGGEFPYPVPNGLNEVAIQFRPFGVNLTFTPVVEANGLIRLKVAPEVSQIDPTKSVRISGFDVPGLSTRRASTTVELKDGESFAIAGLFQRDYINSVKQVPGAGDVPVLGALFKSASFKRNESELVIIVTPRLTTASERALTAPNPLADGREATAIDLILANLALDKPMTAASDPKVNQ